ncbi:type II and III secretion system protein family protein [Sphingomonas sp. URHD0057]|uniref:type II and III secretion system protein family protein n=1 Tax=Sphingomonas sp. URHD0057 TaxID=1380389 RepID=UPI000688020F|nr:type II and III secretion system protein family protein [Sphingomonas sp. URHD0057]
MNSRKTIRRARLGTAFAALAIALASVSATAPAVAQPSAARPSESLNLSQGTGTMVRLSDPMSDVFVADDNVADVQVRSPNQLYIFGKKGGETTVYATGKSGRVVYAANVRVGNNYSTVGEMLHLAMPEAAIQATPMNNLVLLTGTVANPEDVAEAQRLTQAYVGEGTQVVTRLRSATPLQVMLKVRIAEVNRSMLKKIGVNLLNRDSRSGHLFGIGRGSPGTINVAKGPADPITGVIPETVTGATFNLLTGGTTLGLFGHIFGTDLLGTLDLMQTDGFASTLAEPNLTALSGETASFLAGGEFPIPVSQGNNAVTIEYKQYGVGLAFTPVVLGDGRISLRVRPEVSELSDAGSVKLGGFTVPSLITRRAETTLELGSGQSLMLGGLLQNRNDNSIEKAPFLGDLPILGSLFRSTSYQRNETELVIVVTPYLVRPVSGQIALPTDGYRAPNDVQQMLMGRNFTGVSGPAGVVPSAAVAVPAGAAPAPGFKL